MYRMNMNMMHTLYIFRKFIQNFKKMNINHRIEY